MNARCPGLAKTQRDLEPSMKAPYTAPSGKFIRRAFDSISPHYDLLNRILSFNAADRWRARAKEVLAAKGLLLGEAILDLGVGTGDFLKEFLAARSWNVAAGLDFASAMMARARKKLPPEAVFVSGDFHDLPFRDASFDLIISGFTLRSVRDMPLFLKGLRRVLRPGGAVAFLDLTRPVNFWHKLFFFPYLKFYLPLVGGLVSGNFAAYRFLSGSVEHFQKPEETMALMKAAGFEDCSRKSFSFGAVTLIIARKKRIQMSDPTLALIEEQGTHDF